MSYLDSSKTEAIVTPPWRNIDLIKGALIAFVFLGHYISGSLDDNIVRYLIYYFHMPLFLGISGFLVTHSKLGKPLHGLAKTLVFRLIIPWLIASAFYIGIIIIKAYVQDGTVDVQLIIGMAVKPYYHLWYVPAYIIYIFVLKLLRCKIGIGCGILLTASGVAALASYGIYDACVADDGVIGAFFYDLRPQFFFYFILGFVLREELQKGRIITRPFALSGAAVLCAVGYALLFEAEVSDLARGAIALVGNGSTIALLARLSVLEKLPENKAVEQIGQNSLFIYLYHVPIVWLLKLMPGYGTLPVYCIGFFIWCTITVVVNKYTPKRRLSKRLARWSGFSPMR